MFTPDFERIFVVIVLGMAAVYTAARVFKLTVVRQVTPTAIAAVCAAVLVLACAFGTLMRIVYPPM